MNLLSGLLIVLCFIVLVSAEGQQSRRQNFKVFKPRRLNPDNLGRRGNTIPTISEIKAPTTTPGPNTTTDNGTGTNTDTSTGTSTTTTTPSATITGTATGTSPPTTTRNFSPFNKKKNNEDHLAYDQLVNRFDQEDLEDMIELIRLRRRKNRRQSGSRRHRNRQ